MTRELYLGMVIDRSAGYPVMMASQFGGMEIEEVAASNPAAILKAYFDPDIGLSAYQARNRYFRTFNGNKPKTSSSVIEIFQKKRRHGLTKFCRLSS